MRTHYLLRGDNVTHPLLNAEKIADRERTSFLAEIMLRLLIFIVTFNDTQQLDSPLVRDL